MVGDMKRALVCLDHFLDEVLEIAKYPKAVRARNMPTVIYSRDDLFLKAWNDPSKLVQSRPSSTAQELVPIHEASASDFAQLLQKNTSATNNFRDAVTGLQKEHASSTASAFSSHRRTPDSRTRSPSSNRTSSRHVIEAGQHLERRAEPSDGPLSARRRVSEDSPNHQDKAYPTAANYPDIPSKFFSNPKKELLDITQGAGSFSVSFDRGVDSTLYRCNLKGDFENDFPQESIEGYGLNKVHSHSTLSVPRTLTRLRNQRSSVPTLTW